MRRGGSTSKRASSGLPGIFGLAALGALLLAGPASPQRPAGGAVHEDALPQARPGFEPVDVAAEVEEIRARRMRELEREAAVDLDYRYATPERRIRARYGSATWNLYEPYY